MGRRRTPPIRVLLQALSTEARPVRNRLCLAAATCCQVVSWHSRSRLSGRYPPTDCPARGSGGIRIGQRSKDIEYMCISGGSCSRGIQGLDTICYLGVSGCSCLAIETLAFRATGRGQPGVSTHRKPSNRDKHCCPNAKNDFRLRSHSSFNALLGMLVEDGRHAWWLTTCV